MINGQNFFMSICVGYLAKLVMYLENCHVFEFFSNSHRVFSNTLEFKEYLSKPWDSKIKLMILGSREQQFRTQSKSVFQTWLAVTCDAPKDAELILYVKYNLVESCYRFVLLFS